MKRPAQGLALLVAAVAAAGCAELLPTEQTRVVSGWDSFAAARETFERIVPETTTRADLQALGIDPYASPNVQLMSYSDILLRFPIAAGWDTQALDRGLRHCLDAGKRCSGYSLTVREVRRERTGNFWMDALGFKRTVDVSGWSFNGLILIVDDRVVYTLYGGSPQVREHEVTSQPLGPLQGIGESARSLVR